MSWLIIAAVVVYLLIALGVARWIYQDEMGWAGWWPTPGDAFLIALAWPFFLIMLPFACFITAERLLPRRKD